MLRHVIGLDLSLTETGYACFSKPYVQPVVEVCKTKKVQGDSLDRLTYISQWIVTRVHPDVLGSAVLVVIEDFSFGSRGQALYEIGGLQYLVRKELRDREISYITIAPSALKKFITGKGNADKARMMKRLLTNFEIDEDNNNAADAIGLALLGCACAGKRRATRVHEKEVVEDLRTKYNGVLNAQ